MIRIRQASGDADMEYVKSVLFDDDEMWDRSSDDYMDRDRGLIDSIVCIWLICIKNNCKVGVSSVTPGMNSVLNVHIHITKPNRGAGTRDIGLRILTWIKEHAPEKYHKLSTKIPVIYKDVIRYARSLGFKEEGVDKRSIMKNKVLIDRINFGLQMEYIK